MSNHNTTDDNGCLLSLVKKIFCQDTSVPEQHTMQIGEPYGFQHVKHVGFDQETGAFTVCFLLLPPAVGRRLTFVSLC